MKAITVRQPWAWAISAGRKLVENRSRGTTYRGLLAIHAGNAWSERGAQDVRVVTAWAPRLTDWNQVPHDAPGFHRGALIAVAHLVDSHPAAGCCRPWGEDEYREAGGSVVRSVHHLVLEDVRTIAEPVPIRGALGLWNVPDDVAAHLLTTEGAR